MSMNEFRGSNGQSLNTMAVAMQEAMSSRTQPEPKPKAAKPVFHNPKTAAAAAQAATTPAPVVDVDLPVVSENSVLWHRHHVGYNFVPRTGVDGTITPTIGWLIDVLGLEYIERETALGTHLVILRNAHPLRAGTEENALYHFYFPKESDSVLAVMDTVEGTVDDIVADIDRRQDSFQLDSVSDELDMAFAISRKMAIVAYNMATIHPMMRKRMDYWHKADYLPSMNY